VRNVSNVMFVQGIRDHQGGKYGEFRRCYEDNLGRERIETINDVGMNHADINRIKWEGKRCTL
jgi:hypothetical protein